MLTIQNSELYEDRFSRLRLIPWWDQAKIAAYKVLVVGAGALGNEILKNLAVLGFRRVVIVDLDRIDESNLSRSVLYRAADTVPTPNPVNPADEPRPASPETTSTVRSTPSQDPWSEQISIC